MTTKLASDQIKGQGINVADYGADGDATDQTAALTAAILDSETIKQVRQDIESPLTSTAPIVYIPSGNYEITSAITGGVAKNTLYLKGEQSHIYDDTLGSVSTAVELSIDSKLEDLVFRGFQDQITIDTNNVNQSTIEIAGCRFINPRNSVITFPSNGTGFGSSSMQLHIHDFQVSMDNHDAVFIDGAEDGPDMLNLTDGWIQWGVTGSSTDRHTLIQSGGIINADGVIMTPLASVSDDAVDAAWFGLTQGDDEIHLNGCRTGAEGGGTTAVHCFAEANDLGSGSLNGIWIDGGTYSQSLKPFIKFWKLPNVININNPAMLNNSLGLHIVDATDSDADATVGGMDIAALSAFAIAGEVWASSPKFLQSWQYNMKDHASLAYSMIWGKYYASVGVPFIDRIDVADLVAAGNMLDVDTGTTRTSTAQGVSQSSVSDVRGYSTIRFTATGVGVTSGRDSRILMNWDNFFEHGIIGAALTSADDVQYTMLVEIDYNPIHSGGANARLKAAGQAVLTPLREGRHTYALPFVYWNTTNADNAVADNMSVSVEGFQWDGANGDIVTFGRIIFVKGFKTTQTDYLTLTQNATAAPTDGVFSDTNLGFSGNVGWGIGDRVEVQRPISSGSTGYVATTGQNTSVWASMGTVA